jgi:hypothetical protein
VTITVDGVAEAWLNRTNINLDEQFNYAYFDTASNKGWNNTVNGTNIYDAIGALTGLVEWNVSFVAVDGWGTNWKWNETDTEELTLASRALVNNPAEPLATDGHGMVLYTSIAPGDSTDFVDNSFESGGPYRTLVPGQTRDKYMKYVTEIRITTS